MGERSGWPVGFNSINLKEGPNEKYNENIKTDKNKITILLLFLIFDLEKWQRDKINMGNKNVVRHTELSP
ncbi:hypothetical protein UF13_11430 [Pantoea agglomerans]|nr:hypothetical protein UF13_11430 [Pantoea agglomerans]